MNKADWDRLTEGRTPMTELAREKCHALARGFRDLATNAYNGMSGADRADAPKHDLAADLLCLLAAGADEREAREFCAAAWLRYAREQRARVDGAPRIEHGPSAGHSVIAHRWVSDDLGWIDHAVQMANLYRDA